MLSDVRVAELRVLAELASGYNSGVIVTTEDEITHVENWWIVGCDEYDDAGLTVETVTVAPEEVLALLDLVEEGRRWAYENGKATGRLERHLARSQGGRWREALAEAWQEGFDAGEQDVLNHERDGYDTECVRNPYKETSDDEVR